MMSLGCGCVFDRACVLVFGRACVLVSDRACVLFSDCGFVSDSACVLAADLLVLRVDCPIETSPLFSAQFLCSGY